MKKVGVYSGTFDPVHNGHIAFALESAQKFNLDKVFFMVEPSPRRKQGVKSVEHRTQMVNLAIKKHDNLGQIIINQERFTPHSTTPVLYERFKGAELYLLMADDMLKHLSSWPTIEELFKKFTLIIGARTKSKLEIDRTIRSIIKLKNSDIMWKVIVPSGNEKSSSKVKRELRKTGASEDISAEVLDYIKSKGLYFPEGE